MELATGLLHPATMDTSPVYTSPTREDYYRFKSRWRKKKKNLKREKDDKLERGRVVGGRVT